MTGRIKGKESMLLVILLFLKILDTVQVLAIKVIFGIWGLVDSIHLQYEVSMIGFSVNWSCVENTIECIAINT